MYATAWRPVTSNNGFRDRSAIARTASAALSAGVELAAQEPHAPQAPQRRVEVVVAAQPHRELTCAAAGTLGLVGGPACDREEHRGEHALQLQLASVAVGRGRQLAQALDRSPEMSCRLQVRGVQQGVVARRRPERYGVVVLARIRQMQGDEVVAPGGEAAERAAKRLRDPAVVALPAVARQEVVGGVPQEGVLEDVGVRIRLGRLPDQSRGDELAQVGLQGHVVASAHLAEQIDAELPADRGGELRGRPGRSEAVDARRQRSVNGHGYQIRPPAADDLPGRRPFAQHPGFAHGSSELFDEERYSF